MPDKHSHIRTGHPLICFSKNDNILSKFPTFFSWFFGSFCLFLFPTAKCLVPVYVRRNRRPRLYHGRPRTCRNKRGTGGNEYKSEVGGRGVETHVIDVDTAEIRVVRPGQHVDAQTGRRVAVTVDGAGWTSLAVASRPVTHVHHACLYIEKEKSRMRRYV